MQQTVARRPGLAACQKQARAVAVSVAVPRARVEEGVVRSGIQRNLVVAVDHTEGAYKAVKWTLQHIYREGDVLHLLHVVPTSSSLVSQPFSLAGSLPPEEGLQEEMAGHARAYFEATFLSLARRFGATAQLDLVPGRCNQAVSAAIVSVAEELSADVVVLSEHRRGPLDHWFSTPVSRQVAAACSRPTLIFHEQ